MKSLNDWVKLAIEDYKFCALQTFDKKVCLSIKHELESNNKDLALQYCEEVILLHQLYKQD
jgi:hypothetical protein